jgi:hypothetical protein
VSFHRICLRTRLAPLPKPCAAMARLSVLSCSESRRAPRSETLLMLSRMMPTVLSISYIHVSGCQTHLYRERSRCAQKHKDAGRSALPSTCATHRGCTLDVRIALFSHRADIVCPNSYSGSLATTAALKLFLNTAAVANALYSLLRGGKVTYRLESGSANISHCV